MQHSVLECWYRLYDAQVVHSKVQVKQGRRGMGPLQGGARTDSECHPQQAADLLLELLLLVG